MFVIFLDYDFWPAMELSRKILSKNWGKVFGFFVIILLINIGGLLTFGVGAIFTLPATACMTYIAFEDIVGSAIRKYSSSQNARNLNSTEYDNDNQTYIQ